MTQRNKPWDRDRKARKPRSLRRFLIVCEDSKSNKFYLEAFKVPKDYAEIVTIGGKGDPLSVVESAIQDRDTAKDNHRPYIHVWCVIDRDEHLEDRYRQAFERAKKEKDVSVIWGNECFELWYLLHFCYRDTAIGRHEIIKKIEKESRLECKYDKGNKSLFQNIYNQLRDKLPTAHQNAQRLLKFNSSPLTNPSTNIHVLVAALEKLQEAADAPLAVPEEP